MKNNFRNAHNGGLEWGKLFGALLRSRRLLKDADAVVTCNRKEAALLKEKQTCKRIVVQPHGVPIYTEGRRERQFQADLARAAETLQVSGRGIRIGTVNEQLRRKTCPK